LGVVLVSLFDSTNGLKIDLGLSHDPSAFIFGNPGQQVINQIFLPVLAENHGSPANGAVRVDVLPTTKGKGLSLNYIGDLLQHVVFCPRIKAIR